MILQPGIEFLLKENLQDKIICDELDKMSENNVTPKFVLTHIMAPHSPFVFFGPPAIISNIGKHIETISILIRCKLVHIN